MKELELKYGCSSNQEPPRMLMEEDRELPITVLSDRSGHINFMDVLNGWQLAEELKKATGLAAVASFKHVSPAGATVGLPLDDTLKRIHWVDDMGDLSPLVSTYARARGADRVSSFGDSAPLSDVCDVNTARTIKREVSGGVIAPGYEPEALGILKSRKNGSYNVIQIDPDYEPAATERKQIYGVILEQGHNNLEINDDMLRDIVTRNREFPELAKMDFSISLITLEYIQSNSVCHVEGRQAIGAGTGQQPRVHCTRLVGSKADNQYLRQAPQVLNLPFVDSIKWADKDNTIDVYMGEGYMDVLADGRWEKTFKVKPPVFTKEERRAWLDTMIDVALGSDAFFPFGDNIDRAYESGVKYMAQPGGPVRDDQVIETCNQYYMVMAFIGVRLSHH